MPVDRLLIIQRDDGEDNEYGEYSPNWVDAYRVWALKRDRDLRERIEAGGTRTEKLRDWRIRWSSSLFAESTARLRVVDDGLTWNIVSMIEHTGRFRDVRRRFIDIQGVTEQT